MEHSHAGNAVGRKSRKCQKIAEAQPTSGTVHFGLPGMGWKQARPGCPYPAPNPPTPNLPCPFRRLHTCKKPFCADMKHFTHAPFASFAVRRSCSTMSETCVDQRRSQSASRTPGRCPAISFRVLLHTEVDEKNAEQVAKTNASNEGSGAKPHTVIACICISGQSRRFGDRFAKETLTLMISYQRGMVNMIKEI